MLAVTIISIREAYSQIQVETWFEEEMVKSLNQNEGGRQTVGEKGYYVKHFKFESI